MPTSEKAERAVMLKHTGLNCCQAVAAALAEDMGLAPEQIVQLASGFGAGMGCMENTCGALVGAAMAAGMKTQGKGTTRYTKMLSGVFAQRCGSVLCKELKGRDTGVVLCPCDDCVRNAVLAYEEIMGAMESV